MFHGKFQECFKSISKQCYGNDKSVSQKLQGVLRKFQGCFKSVSHMIQEGFKSHLKQVSRGVSKGFQGSFMEVSRKFQENFKVLIEV